MSEGQLFLIGIVASAILYFLKLLASLKWTPSKEVVAIGLYAVSFGLAAWFSGVGVPAFPPFADAPTFVTAFLDFCGQLLAIAAPVAGMAYLIYNILLKRVFEGAAKFLKRKK